MCSSRASRDPARLCGDTFADRARVHVPLCVVRFGKMTAHGVGGAFQALCRARRGSRHPRHSAKSSRAAHRLRGGRGSFGRIWVRRVVIESADDHAAHARKHLRRRPAPRVVQILHLACVALRQPLSAAAQARANLQPSPRRKDRSRDPALRVGRSMFVRSAGDSYLDHRAAGE